MCYFEEKITFCVLFLELLFKWQLEEYLVFILSSIWSPNLLFMFWCIKCIHPFFFLQTHPEWVRLSGSFITQFSIMCGLLSYVSHIFIFISVILVIKLVSISLFILCVVLTAHLLTLIFYRTQFPFKICYYINL